MKNLLIFLLITMSVSTYAAVYKCEKNGQIIYSDNPCGEAHIVVNRNTNKPIAGLEAGLSDFENGDYVSALTKLSPLANNGDAMAQNTLGRMYLQGHGVPQDFNKALILFHKAASQGLANAQSNLGVMYAAGNGVPQDYRVAVTWFKKAANQGFAIAMNNLADIYENGLGMIPNHVEAEKWRNKAQGIESVKRLDLVEIKTVGSNEYENGLNLYYKYAFKEAFELFHKAAEKGHPEAQMKLATMYHLGQGVQKSEAQSQFWTRLAKAKGHTPTDGRDRITLIDISPEEMRRMEMQVIRCNTVAECAAQHH